MLTCALIVWILQPVNFDYTELRETFLTEQECISNLSNKKQYSNFQVLEELSKIMKIKPKYELKQISKKESITQFYKSGDDISKFINYKSKYLDLKKILMTNLKWFKKIY